MVAAGYVLLLAGCLRVDSVEHCCSVAVRYHWQLQATAFSRVLMQRRSHAAAAAAKELYKGSFAERRLKTLKLWLKFTFFRAPFRPPRLS